MMTTTSTGSLPYSPRQVAGTAMRSLQVVNLLSLAIALGQLTATHPPIPTNATSDQTPPALTSVGITRASIESDLLFAISDLHERLLAASVELPQSAASVLYANLWDLYQD